MHKRGLILCVCNVCAKTKEKKRKQNKTQKLNSICVLLMYEHHKEERAKITKFFDPCLTKCFFCCWVNGSSNLTQSDSQLPPAVKNNKKDTKFTNKDSKQLELQIQHNNDIGNIN